MKKYDKIQVLGEYMRLRDCISILMAMMSFKEKKTQRGHSKQNTDMTVIHCLRQNDLIITAECLHKTFLFCFFYDSKLNMLGFVTQLF